MSQGEMQKAAEELAKLDMPELDRKTEKSITEQQYLDALSRLGSPLADTVRQFHTADKTP